MANRRALTKCLIALLLITGSKSQKFKTPQNEVDSETTTTSTTPQTADNPQEGVLKIVVPNFDKDVAKKEKKVIIMDEYVQCVVLSQPKPPDDNKEEENWRKTLSDLENYEAVMLILLLLVMVVEMVLLIRIRAL